MPDKFYVDLSRLDDYARLLKKQADQMEEAGLMMMKQTRAFSGVLEDALTARVEEELRYMQRSVDRIRGELSRIAADTRKAEELYQLYLQRGDII